MKKYLLLSALMPMMSIAQTSEAYVAPGDLRTFLDYNIGADTSLPSSTPSLGIKGDKFQWGLPNKVDNLTNWNLPPAPDTALSDINKTANDPCPDGYRIPTASEWQGVISNNAVQWIGDFYEEGSTYNRHTSGLLVNNSLFLPAAGNQVVGGALYSNNGSGLYWSTTASGNQNNASALVFSWTGQMHSSSKHILVNPIYKSRAGNIRCIKEEQRSLLLLSTSDVNRTKKGNVIYPNPAKGEFFIDSDSKFKVELYDSKGKVLISKDVNGSSKEAINVSGLSNGVYLVKVTIAGKTSTEKLIVKN